VLPLKMAVVPYLSYAPIFIAVEEGYFAEQGLQIEFLKFNRSDAAIPALDQGQLDVVGAVISAGVLNAIARGARIKIVIDRGYLHAAGCDYTTLIARRALIESGALRNLAQLRGRSLAINPNSMEAYYVEKLLRPEQLTLEDLRIVDLPPTVLLDAFANHTIDLAVVSEPWLTRLQHAGHAVSWQSVKQTLPDFQLAFLLYGPNLLTNNPEAGRRFMRAYVKAVRQLGQGKTDRHVEILAKHTQLDRALLSQACWPVFRADGQLNVQSVLDFQTWALSKKLMDAPLTVEQFWDPRFAQEAADQIQER
jgi:NitT/TauT family transport system substrate-binding protein